MNEQDDQVKRLAQEILALRLKIVEAERDIARKELEIFKLASTPQPVPVIQRGTFPKLVRDFLDTINGDSFRAKDVFAFAEHHQMPLDRRGQSQIRSVLSQEHRSGRLCKTLTGYKRPQ